MNATVAKVPAKASAKAAARPAVKAAAKVVAKAPVKAPKKVATKAAVKASVKIAKPVEITKPIKPVKIKLVRDSFTMPSDEYAQIAALKQKALAAAHPVKKSELLRAGIKLLAGLSDTALLKALKNVRTIKTGRPKSKKGD